MDNLLIEIRGLKTYFFLQEGTVRAVDGVNLDIPRGKTMGVIGESGCGKSVTAQSILHARVIQHESGSSLDQKPDGPRSQRSPAAGQGRGKNPAGGGS